VSDGSPQEQHQDRSLLAHPDVPRERRGFVIRQWTALRARKSLAFLEARLFRSGAVLLRYASEASGGLRERERLLNVRGVMTAMPRVHSERLVHNHSALFGVLEGTRELRFRQRAEERAPTAVKPVEQR
jgi:hypothetical protein